MTPGKHSRGSPSIDRHLDPVRHRHSANTAVLSDEVDDAPAVIALLDVREGQRRHLRTSEPTAEEHSKNGPIAQAPRGGDVRRVQESLGLTSGQQVSRTYTYRLRALHASDAGGQLWCEQAVIGCL